MSFNNFFKENLIGILLLGIIASLIASAIYDSCKKDPNPPDPTTTPEPVQEFIATYIFKDENLIIRDQPNNSGQEIIKVPYGAKVNFLDAGLNPDTIRGQLIDWWRIEYEGMIGFCQSNNLEFIISDAPLTQVNIPVNKYKESYWSYANRIALLGIKSKINGEEVDPDVPEKSVLHFYHKRQKITRQDVRKGIKLPIGSTIEIIVSTKYSKIRIPNLLCKRYDEAEFIISAYNFQLGELGSHGNIEQKNSAFVYK